jgi:uncharacterized RDD family membrane protein YckC
MDNIEDINLEEDLDVLFDDDFDFKPITKGLGFHHSVKDKAEVSASLKNQQVQLKNDIEQRAKKLNTSVQVSKPAAASMGDLAPFYQEQKKEDIQLKIEETEISETETLIAEEANGFLRFAAWMLDMVIVSVLFFISFVSMMLTSNTPLSMVREILFTADLFLTVMPIFGIFYVFYFSFFDKTSFSTPGKKLVGLKVVKLNGKNISMLQALMRSIITVLSVMTFGLLTILDAQGKLTDTKVIKR